MIKKDSNWNSVAVILVNYNGEKILPDCIDSLIDKSGEDVEILVVDNGSQDNSMKYIENHYPYVHTMYLKNNIGWGAGCNTGIHVAFARGSRYVLLLNTDTEIEEGMVQELLKYCDDNTLAIPRIYKDKKNKENSLWYSGGKINFDTADVEQTLFKYDSSNEFCNNPKMVEFATGCCMLISKASWEKTGDFDEEYFLYYEDADYCMRLKECGIGIAYVPEAALWHKVGGSSGGEVSDISQYYTVRNRLFFADRYKQYMNNDVIDILKIMLEQRTYFTTPYDKKYQKVVLAGIKDYMQGIRGKERNLFHDNYAVICGFYDMEKTDDGKYWQWSGESESEIEVWNSDREKMLLELTGNIWLPEEIGERKIDIYWNGKYHCSINAPKKNFSIQGIAETGEKIKIRFVTEVQESGDPHLRRLVFCLENMEVSSKKVHGFASISGFYDIEEEDEKYWQWSGEKESEIEAWNDAGEEKLLELTGNIWLPEGVEEKKLDVYWNGEYRSSIYAPQAGFSVQGLAKAGEKVRIKLVADELDKNEEEEGTVNSRKLVFSLENAEVRKHEQHGYMSVSGFYGIEEDDGKYWQWSGEKESEIEAWNDAGEEKLLELTGNIWLPEGVEEKKLDVYWNGEYRSSIYAPQADFSIQGLADAGEKVKIRFKIEDKKGRNSEESGARKLLFNLENARVSLSQEYGYATIKGFYALEENAVNRWQWCGEREAEIEAWNITNKKEILEFMGNMCLPDKIKERYVDVFWNGEYLYGITAPYESFCIQGIAEPGEKVRIKFCVKDVPEEKEQGRNLFFSIYNGTVKASDYRGCVLGNGIYETEHAGENTWNWVSRRNLLIYLKNEDEMAREGILSFMISPAPTRDNIHITVIEEETGMSRSLGAGWHQMKIQFEPNERKILQFSTEDDPVEGFNGDFRKLLYQIGNVQLEML